MLLIYLFFFCQINPSDDANRSYQGSQGDDFGKDDGGKHQGAEWLDINIIGRARRSQYLDRRIPGDKAKHGAIMITTTEKNDELKSVMDEFRSKGRFNATKLASGKSSGSTPLIVIDGDVKGNMPEILSNIACSDVESITVLKQQDIAFRLYGDKAKDGVILITMKK